MARPKKVKEIEEVKEVEEVKEIEEVKEKVKPDEFQFFGEVDYNRNGRISSQYPAWAFRHLINELAVEISELEKQVKDYSLDAETRGKIISRLEVRKERLDKILESFPKVDKDKVHFIVGDEHEKGSLGEKISDSMFTNSEMQKGLADAHEEDRRMHEPIIKLDGKEIAMAKGCNVRIGRDGKVSRNDAVKIWKIGRKYLGEMSNVEVLRRG